MRKIAIVLTLLLFVTLNCFSMGVKKSSSVESEVFNVNEPIWATTFEGNALGLSYFKDHELTLLNIWATNCGPCIQEMPHLDAISKKRDDINIVGLCFGSLSKMFDQKMIDEAKSILNATGATYTNVYASQDFNAQLVNIIQAFPATMFISSDGSVVHLVYGAKSEKDWNALIDTVLESVRKKDNQ